MDVCGQSGGRFGPLLRHISGKVKSIGVALCSMILRDILEPKYIVNNHPNHPNEVGPTSDLLQCRAPIRGGNPISIDHH